MGEDANFTTALVWGQNNLTTEGKTNFYLAEADYQRGRDTVFTRIENIQKSGHELVLPEESLHDRKFTLGAYTLGYVRDLTHGTGIDTGLGLAVTADTKPSALDADYGGGTPVSFQTYLRRRPSRMKAMDMKGMDMGAGQTPPTAPAPAMPDRTPDQTRASAPPLAAPAPPVAPSAAPAAPVTVSEVAATITPDPPKARTKNTLTLALTDSSGKPVLGAKIAASVEMTSMDMGTTHPLFQETGGGRYKAAVAFSMPGPWHVTLRVTPPNGGAIVTKTLDYAAAR